MGSAGGGTGHAPNRAAGVPDEVDAIDHVKEAIHVPLCTRLSETSLAGAGHAKGSSGRDAEQVEIGIAERKLALQLGQVGGEQLHRREVDARRVVLLPAA